jgi:hypothetical protein
MSDYYKGIVAEKLYEFLKDNDALGEMEDMSADDAIGELTEYLSDPECIRNTLGDIKGIADDISDDDFYASDIEPLVKDLESLLESPEAERTEPSKRMVADTGYEVKQAIHIGDREIIIAENPNAADGQTYMKAEYAENGIIGEYSRIIYTSNYLSAMEEFSGAITQKVEALRNEFAKMDYQAAPVTADDCYLHDYGEDINGKVVAIKADALRDEYRRGDVQMVLISGGNGARGNARGSAVYCYHLNSGEQTRFERQDVLGVVKELSGWAKERVTTIQSEREAEQQSKTAPEVVAGYTITERIQVGDKAFARGENPEAVSPFVTWRFGIDNEGGKWYEWGHYLSTKKAAVKDLHARADNERDRQNPNKAKRNRDDAR